MLYLNIIPAKLKKETQLNSIYKLCKKLILSLSVVFLLFVISLLVVELIMQANLVKTVDETTLVTKNTENSTAKVRAINDQLSAIENIQNDMVYWSYLLEFISRHTNEGISFSRVTTDKKKGTLTLLGHASARDDLLSLKDSIDESSVFTDVNFPIQNLLEKNDINFEISMKFKDYDFKNLQ